MEATNLAKTEPSPPDKAGRGAWAFPFPYSNWGPQAAVLGLLFALGLGVCLGLPAVIADGPSSGESLSTWASIVVQAGTALAFLLVPVVLASLGSGAAHLTTNV